MNGLNRNWSRVGVFPTPGHVVRAFAEFTSSFVKYRGKDFDVLDLFAGDGRLGLAIKNVFKDSELRLTYVEVRRDTIGDERLNGHAKLVRKNAFRFKSTSKFDLVVSNPPYLALNSRQSDILGINWADTRKAARNLYGLGILKALELCKLGSYVCVIAPFGYLRGVNSALFREELERQCTEIIINGYSSRTMFDEANQDIAFQVFRKRNSNEKLKTKWRFAYDGSEDYRTIHVNLPFSKTTAEKHVRVGPIVWNRKREYLRGRYNRNIALIYGGNITHDGRLEIPSSRYSFKQYINKKGTLPTDILSAPFIVIRRTLRGKPGSWKVDSALVSELSISCTAENHVIVVELPKLGKRKLKEIHHRLDDMIRGYYFHSGSPNISTRVVSQMFGELIGGYL